MRLRLASAAAALVAWTTLLAGIIVAPLPAHGGAPVPCPRSIAGQDLERQDVDETDLPGSRGLSCFYEDGSVSVLYFVTDEGTTGSCTDDARDRLGAEFALYDPNRERRVVVSGTVHEGEPRPFIDVGYTLLEAYAPLAAPCFAEVATTAAPTVPSTTVSPPTGEPAPVTGAAPRDGGDDSISQEAIFLAVGIIMIALGILGGPFLTRFYRALRQASGVPSDAELEARFGDRDDEHDS